jgi:hypothetical protein
MRVAPAPSSECSPASVGSAIGKLESITYPSGARVNYAFSNPIHDTFLAWFKRENNKNRLLEQRASMAVKEGEVRYGSK